MQTSFQTKQLCVAITLAMSATVLTACGGGSSDGGNSAPIQKLTDRVDKEKFPKFAIEGDFVELPKLTIQGLPIRYRQRDPDETCDLIKDDDGYKVKALKALTEDGSIRSCNVLLDNDGGNARVHNFTSGYNFPIYPKCSEDEVRGEGDHYCIPKLPTITTTEAPITIAGSPLEAKLIGYQLSPNLQVSTTACDDLSEIKVVESSRDTQILSFSCNPKVAGSFPLTIKSTDGESTLFNQNIEVQLPQVLGGSKKLTKTGVNTCSTDEANDLACTLAALGEAWFGLRQDGEVQAGMPLDYSKKQYSNPATNQTEVCIQDNSTGLIWEAKTDDNGLQDKDWTYSWYNTNSALNGGEPGVEGNDTCGGTLDDKCNTQAYVQALNEAKYCGYDDWRVPEEYELVSLVDYGRKHPTINPIFTNTMYDADYYSKQYWSNTTKDSFGAFTAGAVEFGAGTTTSGDYKDYASNYIRAVRADAQ